MEAIRQTSAGGNFQRPHIISAVPSPEGDGAEFYKADCGVMNYLGGESLVRHGAVSLQIGQKAPSMERALDIDVSSLVWGSHERKARVAGASFDARYSILACQQGSTDREYRVGRIWHFDGAVGVRGGRSWGDSTMQLCAPFSAVCLPRSDRSSMSAWAAVVSKYAAAAAMMPAHFSSDVSTLLYQDVNTIRFVYRLAALYVAALLHGDDQGTIFIREATRVETHLVDSVQVLLRTIASAMEGRNFVAFCPKSHGPLYADTGEVLLLAASRQVRLHGVPLVCWPEINHLQLATEGVGHLHVPLSLRASSIYLAASSWCLQYSNLKFFEEAVETLLLISCRPDGLEQHWYMPDPTISLPAARMGVFALAGLLEGRELSDASPAEPEKGLLLNTAQMRAALLYACIWRYAYYASVFFACLGLEALEKERSVLRHFQYQSCRHLWGYVQYQLAILGVSGEVGQVFGTLGSQSNVRLIRRGLLHERAQSVDWVELAAMLPHLPVEAGCWGCLYPLRPDCLRVRNDVVSCLHLALSGLKSIIIQI